MSKIREVEEENKDIDPDGAKRVNNTFTEMNQKRLLQLAELEADEKFVSQTEQRVLDILEE